MSDRTARQKCVNPPRHKGVEPGGEAETYHIALSNATERKRRVKQESEAETEQHTVTQSLVKTCRRRGRSVANDTVRQKPISKKMFCPYGNPSSW